MYGLVNRAIHELIASNYDDATWERIRIGAGIEQDVFLSMETYPDEVTNSLVGAAAKELHVSPDEVLRRFGEFWIDYASRHGYRDLLRARGESLFGFIARLDELHSRLSLVFPRLRPPSFRTEILSPTQMRLHYISEREGLAPFVVGLIHGVAKVFAHPVRIEHTKRRDQGHSHEEFLVETG